MEQIDKNATGEDAANETSDFHVDTELNEEVLFDESADGDSNEDIGDSLMVGAIGTNVNVDYNDSMSDGMVSLDGYQRGDKFNVIYALRTGVDNIVMSVSFP